eukprot:3526421-Rhodomonas_salina.1
MEQKVSYMEVEESLIGNQVQSAAGDDNNMMEPEPGHDSDSEELQDLESDMVERRGRKVPDVFKRDASALFKGPWQSADDEEAFLMSQDLDGISQHMYLGANVDGTPLYLPPMAEGEVLHKVSLTNHKSQQTLVVGNAKLLAQEELTGLRNVGMIECWRQANGAESEPLQGKLEFKNTFVDNMTVWAAEKWIPIQLFSNLDLEFSPGMSAGERFAVTCCGNEKKTLSTVTQDDKGPFQIREKFNHKYCVMLAGVNMDTISVMHELLQM